jgi:hypothetical protein
MTRHTLVARAAALALALFAAAVVTANAQTTAAKTGAAPGATPEAFVTAFYRAHFAHKQRFDLTVKRERAKFAPELLALLDEDAKRSAANPDEIVGLDFDPFINAQEEATRFKLSGTTREGADAIVAVSLYFGSEARPVRVRLTPSGASWRISNFVYDEGDLVSILKELRSQPAQ